MKKWVIALVALLILGLAAPAVFAAVEPKDAARQDLAKLYAEMHNLRKQIIEKQVEAGDLTREQADAILKNLEQRWQYMIENNIGPWTGKAPWGSGFRRGPGFGRGMMGGFGSGAGFGCPMWGAYNNAPAAPNN